VHVASLLPLLPPKLRFTCHIATFHLLSPFHTHFCIANSASIHASSLLLSPQLRLRYSAFQLDAPPFFGLNDIIPSWTHPVQIRGGITRDLGYRLGDRELDFVNIFWSCVVPFGPVALFKRHSQIYPLFAPASNLELRTSEFHFSSFFLFIFKYKRALTYGC
jgi:hypothetical protein